MIEQYIYTRADGQLKTNANGVTFGFGLTHFTPGIEAYRQPVTDISYYVNEATDAEGNQLRIISKRRLPRTENMMCLQQSYNLPTRPRPTPVTHGYVGSVDDECRWAEKPELWFGLEYFSRNPNEENIYLSAIAQPEGNAPALRPLADVLRDNGLTLEQFITAVRGCFDAENYKTMVLIAHDYMAPDAQELGHQLIRWLYRFQPFAMRRESDFTTCFDDNAIGGDFTVALVPATQIVQRGAEYAIRSRRGYDVGSGYLFAGGTVRHRPSPRYADFDTSGSPYAVWLEQVIRTVYNNPAEQSRLLDTIDEIYHHMDGGALIGGLSPAESTRVEYYDSLCWVLATTDIYSGAHMDAADEAVKALNVDIKPLLETLIEFRTSAELQKQTPLMLSAACMSVRSGGDNSDWMRILCKRDPDGTMPAVQEILKICMAAAMDRAPQGGVHAAAEEFFGRRGIENGSPERLALTEQVLFVQADENQRTLWTASGCDLSEDTLLLRRKRWTAEYVMGLNSFPALCAVIERFVTDISAFSRENAESMVSVFMELTRDIGGRMAAQNEIDSLARACAEPDKITQQLNFDSELIHDYFVDIVGQIYPNVLQLVKNRPSLETAEACLASFGPLRVFSAAKNMLAKLLQAIMKNFGHADPAARIMLMPPAENTYERVCRIINALLQVGGEEAVTEAKQYYIDALAVMVNAADKYITRKFLQNWEGLCPFRIEDILPRSQFFPTHALMVLSRFLRGGEYSYQNYCQAVCGTVGEEITERADLTVTSLLYTLFMNGQWNDLKPELVDYCYMRQCSIRDMDAPAREDYLAMLLHCQGVRGITKLLEMYPTAPVVYETRSRYETEMHPAKYEWMRTNEEFVRAVDAVASRQQLMMEAAGENEMAMPKLIDTVDRLLPDGCEFRTLACRICRCAFNAWDNSQVQKSDSAKFMKMYRKEGLFGG